MGNYSWDNKRIVIADDDDINFELLKLMLKNTNVEIKHFKNGQLVVDFIQSNCDVDLIIMDIQMPVLDGIEATQKLRGLNYSGIILALTALNTTKDAKKYRDIGFDEIVEKPVRRESFLKLLDSFLN
jgi:CheY-like chemotaxis protein